jgi:hypothetical protein
MAWFDAANAAVAQVFCDTPAVWVKNGVTDTPLLLAVDIELSQFTIERLQISSAEQKVFGCSGDQIDGMKRKDIIAIDGVSHEVLRTHIDSTGWAEIVVEKVR